MNKHIITDEEVKRFDDIYVKYDGGSDDECVKAALAAYLERTGAEFEYQPLDMPKRWFLGGKNCTPSEYEDKDYTILPVLRYGLPSHLQSEIANPDGLTEEQICEGGKYRAVLKSEINDQSVDGAMYWSKGFYKWMYYSHDASKLTFHDTLRLPATVPWPDWEHREATQLDPKDARIAELEGKLEEARAQCDKYVSLIFQIYHATGFLDGECELKGVKRLRAEYDAVLAKLAASPWRRMSEVPTEEDADSEGNVLVRDIKARLELWPLKHLEGEPFEHLVAWMPAPKFPGWPDPLADLLKTHGVEVTPEILAALNAWKGVGE